MGKTKAREKTVFQGDCFHPSLEDLISFWPQEALAEVRAEMQAEDEEEDRRRRKSREASRIPSPKQRLENKQVQINLIGRKLKCWTPLQEGNVGIRTLKVMIAMIPRSKEERNIREKSANK